MLPFQYYNPTKVVFGCGEFDKLKEECAALGTHALLVEQHGPLEELGVFDKAKKLMQAAGIIVSELQGIASNPRLSKVEEGIRIAKEQHVDIIVAVGGGSTIDTAKAIAIGALSSDDVWEFFEGTKTVKGALPVVAVSTISATGAETSCHCVITNDRSENPEDWQKWALHDPYAFPKTAIIDPLLLVSVPPRLTAAGMADTISHIIEGYFDGINDNPVSDRIGEGIVMTILEQEHVLQNPDDLEARAAIAWASTLAMSGLQDCGRLNAGFPAHWIQHAVGALTDSSHGEGLAVINPAWLYFVNQKQPEKFVQFTQRVFRFPRPDGMSDTAYGQLGIDELQRKFAAWGLPQTLKALGVKKDMFPQLVHQIMNNNEAYPFQEHQIINVLEKCFE